MRHTKALGIVVLALAAAACSSASGETRPEPIPTTTSPSTPTTSPSTPTTTPPTTNVSTGSAVAEAVTVEMLAQGPEMVSTGAASGSGCSPGSESTLPSGWWAGEVTGVQDTGFDFDLVCVYMGEGVVQAAAQHGLPEYEGEHYLVDDSQRTRRVDFPSATGAASCVHAGRGDSFPCEIRHILQLYNAPTEVFRMENSELVPDPGMSGDTLQGGFVLWVHVGADGTPDYAYMQWSC